MDDLISQSIYLQYCSLVAAYLAFSGRTHDFFPFVWLLAFMSVAEARGFWIMSQNARDFWLRRRHPAPFIKYLLLHGHIPSQFISRSKPYSKGDTRRLTGQFYNLGVIIHCCFMAKTFCNPWMVTCEGWNGSVISPKRAWLLCNQSWINQGSFARGQSIFDECPVLPLDPLPFSDSETKTWFICFSSAGRRKFNKMVPCNWTSGKRWSTALALRSVSLSLPLSLSLPT